MSAVHTTVLEPLLRMMQELMTQGESPGGESPGERKAGRSSLKP